MTPEQLEAIIQRSGVGAGKRRQYPSHADHAAAFADYLRMAAFERVKDPEPLARQWHRDHLNIYQVREASGLTSSDFGDAMESSVSLLLRQQFADASGDIAAITRRVEVSNFKPVELPSFSLGETGEVPEDGDLPIMPVAITESASAGRLKTYGAVVRFSRAIFETHGPAILQSLAAYARSFYLKEMELLSSLLENADLPTQTGLTFNAAGLNSAMKTLRTQANSAGQLANWLTRSLIVPADLEGAAMTLRQSMGAKFNIVVSPALSVATTWFLVCDPANSPLLRMVLRNGGQPSVYLNRRRGTQEGAEFSVSHDCDFSIAGDTSGILKCTA